MFLAFLLIFQLALTETSTHPNSEIAYQHLSSNEAVCKYNVSQTIVGSYQTVAKALNQTCSQTDGYEITLLDSEHIEFLKINKSSSILINGSKRNPTIWQLNTSDYGIIDLYKGNLTLKNIEFHFVLLKYTKSSISPNIFLIRVSNTDDQSGLNVISTSLTLNKCIFQSVAYNDNNQMYQVLIQSANRFEVDNCVFKGIGMTEESCIQLLFVNLVEEIVIKNTKFQDLQTNSLGNALTLYGQRKYRSFVIYNCEFINLTYTGQLQCASLAIMCENVVKAKISGNKFLNCTSVTSLTGALYIHDWKNVDGTPSEYAIEGNTFINNTGNLSGAIFVQQDNEFSKFSFRNNKFSQNLNNQSTGLGKDSFMNVSNTPDGWTKENIALKIGALFKGSQTDAGNGSVYYMMGSLDPEVEPAITGDVSLPELRDKWWQNTYIIIGIVVGLVVLIAAIVSIIFIKDFAPRKKKFKYGSQIEDIQFLINHGSKKSK